MAHKYIYKILFNGNFMIKQFLFFLFPIFVFSQNDSIVNGKIVSNANEVEGILVRNISNNQEVVTQRGGYFSIFGKTKDTLIFSAFNLKAETHVITDKDFGENLVFITMQLINNQLKEVTIIDYKNINAEALGIVPKGQKTYTPAERKLKTAGEMSIGSVISVDPLLNWISGRTSMLKKELEVEKKELLQAKMTNNYEREYIVNTLKVPEEYVDGFLFYAAENERFAAAMKAKNYTMATFVLSELASQYRELQGFEVLNTVNKTSENSMNKQKE